jgi:hypothetical protein
LIKTKRIFGALLKSIPLINFIYYGYLVEVIRNKDLPKWDKWVKKFEKGLFVSIIFLIYNIPLIILVYIQNIPLQFVFDVMPLEYPYLIPFSLFFDFLATLAIIRFAFTDMFFESLNLPKVVKTINVKYFLVWIFYSFVIVCIKYVTILSENLPFHILILLLFLFVSFVVDVAFYTMYRQVMVKYYEERNSSASI